LAYKHPHALIQPGKFRLLQLKQRVNSAQQNEILTVSFKHANVAEKSTEYVSLSYAWGSVEPTARLKVRMGRKSYCKSITPNLEAALRRLQLVHEGRWIRVDALCIN
jgi:hypothetical protein